MKYVVPGGETQQVTSELQFNVHTEGIETITRFWIYCPQIYFLHVTSILQKD